MQKSFNLADRLGVGIKEARFPVAGGRFVNVVRTVWVQESLTAETLR